MIILTTEEILENSWGQITKEKTHPLRTPAKWLFESQISFDDIKEWEEIYYCPGLVGVYVAWNPYEEFYIIVHNLHLEKKYIEIFQGENAVGDIVERCRILGINLPVQEVQIN